MNIYPVGIELFHSDGKTEEQTDRHDEIFRHLGKALKTCFAQLFCAEVTRGQICEFLL